MNGFSALLPFAQDIPMSLKIDVIGSFSIFALELVVFGVAHFISNRQVWTPFLMILIEAVKKSSDDLSMF